MASRSQILPRAVLTMYEPRFMVLISASSNSPSVSGCSGALMVTTSHTATRDAGVGWIGEAELGLHLLGEPVAVGVVQLDVERLEPPQDGTCRCVRRRRSRPSFLRRRRRAPRSRRCSSHRCTTHWYDGM